MVKQLFLIALSPYFPGGRGVTVFALLEFKLEFAPEEPAGFIGDLPEPLFKGLLLFSTQLFPDLLISAALMLTGRLWRRLCR